MESQQDQTEKQPPHGTNKYITRLKNEITRDRLIGARFLITEQDQSHLTEVQKISINSIVRSLNSLIEGLKR